MSITQTGVTTGGNSTSDRGLPIKLQGVVWSTNPNPRISLSTKTSYGTRIGSFTSLLTNLTPKTTCYVRAYAANSVDTAYCNEIFFTTKSDSTSVMGIPCPGTPTVKDIDGNIYNTIQIGTQCWTKENLRVSRFKNGNSIPLVNDNSQWIALTSGARSWYQNDSIKYAIPYVNYYNSFAIKDDRGICPINWHVPNIMEFDSLVNFLGGYSSAGSKMKYIGPNYWVGENTIGNNESGFSAIPGGYRTNVDGGGYFSQFGSDFWLLLLDKNSDLHFRSLHQNSIQVHNPTAFGYYNHFNKNTGVPVRCLKNQ